MCVGREAIVHITTNHPHTAYQSIHPSIHATQPRTDLPPGQELGDLRPLVPQPLLRLAEHQVFRLGPLPFLHAPVQVVQPAVCVYVCVGKDLVRVGDRKEGVISTTPITEPHQSTNHIERERQRKTRTTQSSIHRPCPHLPNHDAPLPALLPRAAWDVAGDERPLLGLGPQLLHQRLQQRVLIGAPRALFVGGLSVGG